MTSLLDDTPAQRRGRIVATELEAGVIQYNLDDDTTVRAGEDLYLDFENMTWRIE